MRWLGNGRPSLCTFGECTEAFDLLVAWPTSLPARCGKQSFSGAAGVQAAPVAEAEEVEERLLGAEGTLRKPAEFEHAEAKATGRAEAKQSYMISAQLIAELQACQVLV